MANQHDTRVEETEIFGFLGDVAYRLIFAGDSLRALAEVWHDRGSEDQQILIQQGCDFTRIGRQLLALREELCNACKIKVVIETLKFPNSAAEANDTRQS